MAINILGFEIGRRRSPKTMDDLPSVEQPVKSFIPPEMDDGASVVDFVGGYGFGVQLINYDVAYRSDGELIQRYRQMSEHAEVQTAIDDIINQAVVLNEKIEPVSLNLDKSKLGSSVKKKVKAEFEEVLRMLNFNTRGSELFKKWYIDGRLYIQILMDEKKQRDGIVELRVIDPMKMQKIRNIEREVSNSGIKFIKRIQEYYLYTADDFVGNGRDTINFRYSNEGIILAPDSVAYINSGFIDPSTKKVLGYLHKAIKPLNQLRMLEDSIVIYRISRAPERRIFYIDVGSLPKNKSEQYLREIMQRYKNKLVYDTATGELRDEKRHMSMLEDFWMPRREGGKGTEVQTLPGGQNLGELQDVDYFLKKLYTSLHVPPSRFREDSGFNMGKAAEISRDEVRFTKFVNRLQAKFSELFMQLLRVQLLSKNILTDEEWREYSYDFSFDYATDQYFAELKENEMLMSRLQTMREAEPYIGRFFSSRWIKKNVLQMTDDEIEIMDTEVKKEAEENPPQPQGMGMGMPIPGQEMMGAEQPLPPEESSNIDTTSDVSDLESEFGGEEGSTEMPEIEPISGEEQEEAGATGATGESGQPSKEDIEDMLDYYNEQSMIKASNLFFEETSNRDFEPSDPLILENKMISHKIPNISPLGMRVLNKVLKKNI